MIKYILGGKAARLTVWRRVLHRCQQRHWKLLSKIVTNRIQRQFDVFLPTHTQIPLSVRFPHPTGIIIGEGCKIGERVIIYQGVTLGNARREKEEDRRYPDVGEDATIFAGAVVIGAVNIGAGSMIGANSVVTKDVAAQASVAGAPARPLSTS